MPYNIENNRCEDKVIFTVFADMHYKEDMYIASVEDMQAILNRADCSGSDFVIHCGDLCNDYIRSPELINAYLDNSYNLNVYGIYGNHELESEDNSMQVVTPLLTNRSNDVVWGTKDGKIGDGSIGYYYFDKGNLRVICLDTNYSWNSYEQIWEHNVTCSYGEPDEKYNQSRYNDETAAGNTRNNSLGPLQLEWLETVLTDAAQKGKKCFVFSHATFNDNWDSCSLDASKVKNIYAKANAISPHTVMLSVNGHYHTNRIQTVDGILFFDVNTVRNGYWKGRQTQQHYLPEHTFRQVLYNEDGTENSSNIVPITKLWQSKNTWFFADPLSAVVTVSLKNGTVEIKGIKSQWIYGVAPDSVKPEFTPQISNTTIRLWQNS